MFNIATMIIEAKQAFKKINKFVFYSQERIIKKSITLGRVSSKGESHKITVKIIPLENMVTI